MEGKVRVPNVLKMAEKLATRVDLKYDCIIDKDSKIYKMLQIGDHVEASDDLIIWENAFDDEASASVMDAISKGSEFSDVGKRKLKSEVTGVITDIRIYRTVELDELSPSIKKIVSAYEKPIKEKAKFFLDRINHLSVREDSGQRIIKELLYWK